MCNDTRSIELFYDECTVFSGKFHIDITNTHDLYLAAPDGFPANHQFVAVNSGHCDIGSIRMIGYCLLIDDVLIFHTEFFGKLKGITDSGVICGKSKNSAQ